EGRSPGPALPRGAVAARVGGRGRPLPRGLRRRAVDPAHCVWTIRAASRPPEVFANAASRGKLLPREAARLPREPNSLPREAKIRARAPKVLTSRRETIAARGKSFSSRTRFLTSRGRRPRFA